MPMTLDGLLWRTRVTEDGLVKFGRLGDLAREIANLAFACFLPAAITPEPGLHRMNGGGGPVEEVLAEGAPTQESSRSFDVSFGARPRLRATPRRRQLRASRARKFGKRRLRETEPGLAPPRAGR